MFTLLTTLEFVRVVRRAGAGSSERENVSERIVQRQWDGLCLGRSTPERQPQTH